MQGASVAGMSKVGIADSMPVVVTDQLLWVCPDSSPDACGLKTSLWTTPKGNVAFLLLQVFCRGLLHSVSSPWSLQAACDHKSLITVCDTPAGHTTAFLVR